MRQSTQASIGALDQRQLTTWQFLREITRRRDLPLIPTVDHLFREYPDRLHPVDGYLREGDILAWPHDTPPYAGAWGNAALVLRVNSRAAVHCITLAADGRVVVWHLDLTDTGRAAVFR